MNPNRSARPVSPDVKLVHGETSDDECDQQMYQAVVGSLLYLSTSGYIFLQGGAAISWKSSKQTCVALSTAEAEYVALSAAVQEAVWLQQLTSDLLSRSIQETSILEDNQSAICLAKNQQVHGRTKHIDIKYHFVRDLVEAGRIKLTYCASEDMVADMFTKGLSINQFDILRRLAGIVQFPH